MKARGFSLIEVVMAMAVLTIGIMGLSELQVIGVKGRDFARNITTASLLAHDLSANMDGWTYTDSRLNPLATVTSTTDPTVTAHWDMGRLVTVTTKAEFGEVANDTNATTSGALGTGYTGIASPSGFYRYWNVFALSLSGGTTAKLVQIIVRWNEPGFGMRQVAFSTVLTNPQGLYR